MFLTKVKLKKLGMSINGDCPFCLKAEENTDHILKIVILQSIFGASSKKNCPNLWNSNLGNVDWLGYLWLNKLWFRKKIYNVPEKVITIMWAICS